LKLLIIPVNQGWDLSWWRNRK